MRSKLLRSGLGALLASASLAASAVRAQDGAPAASAEAPPSASSSPSVPAPADAASSSAVTAAAPTAVPPSAVPPSAVPPAPSPLAPTQRKRQKPFQQTTPSALSTAPAGGSSPFTGEAMPVDAGQSRLAETRPLVPAPDTPRIDGWLGVHVMGLPNPGYDAFSDDDSLTSFTAGIGAMLGEIDSARLALVASVSTGGSEASYRGQAADLSLVRLSLGPELRLPFGSRFYAYGRLSPMLLHAGAELYDASSQATLEQSKWLFGVDSALGVSVRFAEVRPDALEGPLCFFGRLEAGYAWSPKTELELSPGGGNGPLRSEPLALGDISYSGVSVRAAIGIGY